MTYICIAFYFKRLLSIDGDLWTPLSIVVSTGGLSFPILLKLILQNELVQEKC